MLYEEHRGPGWTGWIIIGAIVVPAVYIGAPLVRTNPAELWDVARFFGVALLGALLLLASPLAFTFGRLRISTAGLWLFPLGLMRLPRSELGDAVIIPEAKAVLAARHGTWGDVRIPTGRSSYSRWGGEGPAVFVEQHRGDGKTVGWLLATREPEVVVEALGEVRGG